MRAGRGFRKLAEKIQLDLRREEIVEVLGEGDIIATLDEDGTLDSLPFIAEMRKFCGKRFVVLRRVEKTVVEGIGMRRMRNVVILKGVACDGAAHGGCQRSCLLFWKEAWLERAKKEPRKNPLSRDAHAMLSLMSHKDDIFSCQSTNLKKATSALPIWDVRRFMWDLSSGVFTPLERLHALLTTVNTNVLELLGSESPFRLRRNLGRIPTVALDLKPGELVEVKSKREVLATLDSRGRNRGLEFIPAMVKHCGGRYRVLKRLDRMVNEETGKMRQIANTVILDDLFCNGKAEGGCQRNCYCFWREAWLRRV